VLPPSNSIGQALESVNNAAVQLAQNVNGARDQLKRELDGEDVMVGRYDNLVKQINDLPTSSVLAPEQLMDLQSRVLPSMRDEALNLIDESARAAQQRQYVSLMGYSTYSNA
jgi:aspartyl/asparaginyl beta-hydroxylase (cupin superfamily)